MALETILIWLSLHEVLPTATIWHRRHMTSSDSCKHCWCHQENVFHCLRDCLKVEKVWRILGFIDATFFTEQYFFNWIKKGFGSEKAMTFAAGHGLWELIEMTTQTIRQYQLLSKLDPRRN
ncbi:hypothetical protein HN51_060917 [Arachis hypogaea]